MSLLETSLTCIPRFGLAARLQADRTLEVLARDGYVDDLTGLRIAVVITSMGSYRGTE